MPKCFKNAAASISFFNKNKEQSTLLFRENSVQEKNHFQEENRSLHFFFFFEDKLLNVRTIGHLIRICCMELAERDVTEQTS